MLRSLLSHSGNQVLKKLSLLPLIVKLTFTQSPQTAKQISQKLTVFYVKKLEKNQIPKKNLIDLVIAAYFRLPLNQSTVNYAKQFPQIFSIEKNLLRTTPAWIKAIQVYTQTKLFTQKLLQIKPFAEQSVAYAELIHQIHKTTYNILAFKDWKPSIDLIFRGSIKSKEIINLKGKLTEKLILEDGEYYENQVCHFRCCSIKPHGCENYDFDFRKDVFMVLGRGMDQESGQTVCAMPTILYSFHGIPIQRYKGNIQPEDVILINHPKLSQFFYLFEPVLPPRPYLK